MAINIQDNSDLTEKEIEAVKELEKRIDEKIGTPEFKRGLEDGPVRYVHFPDLPGGGTLVPKHIIDYLVKTYQEANPDYIITPKEYVKDAYGALIFQKRRSK